MFLVDLLLRVYLSKSLELEDKEFEFVNMVSCVSILDFRLEEIREEI